MGCLLIYQQLGNSLREKIVPIEKWYELLLASAPRLYALTIHYQPHASQYTSLQVCDGAATGSKLTSGANMRP